MIVQTSEFQSCLPNNKQSQSVSQPARQPKCSINYILIYAYFRFFVLTLLLNLLIITLAALVWLFLLYAPSYITFMFANEQCLQRMKLCQTLIRSTRRCFFFRFSRFYTVLSSCFFHIQAKHNRFVLHSFKTCAIFFFVSTSYHTELEVHSMSTICNYI